MPMAKEINPRLVFDRLFGSRLAIQGRAETGRGAIVTTGASSISSRDDARQLQRGSASNDRRKLDEYLNGSARSNVGSPGPARDGGLAGTRSEPAGAGSPRISRAHPADARPHGPRVPGRPDADQHVHVRQRGEQSELSHISVPDGHHDLSHHGNDPRKHDKIRKINRFHVGPVRLSARQAESIREGDGTSSITP